MLQLTTLHEHDRMSTQELLLQISAAVRSGETEFTILASGQHDIGGPLWNPDGKTLHFRVQNPGQRLGCMCLPGTEIIAEGSVPADAGWLNSGGHIVVLGDAGDTAGHCAAGGSLYIGGRAGTRSGSLMKHDPLCAEPELWILKSTGSFSFEFMGGGRAVVCGADCTGPVIGDRGCVGMVGGVVYVRGPVSGLALDDVHLAALDADDRAWLAERMPAFLSAVARPELTPQLTNWSEWQKILPHGTQHAAPTITMQAFRADHWVSGGIFADVFADDFAVNTTVMHGACRLRVPSWDNAKTAAPCEWACPASIPTQRRFNLLRQGRYEEACRLVLEFSPFPGSVCGSVCPNPCMDACTRNTLDTAVQIGPLGRASITTDIAKPAQSTGYRVAVLGGGVGGLSAAWQLARKGHEVTVYEADSCMGGKLEQVIPRERLPHAILEQELARIEGLGVHFVTNHPVDAARFAELRLNFDAVIVATGGHKSRIFPWPGSERIVSGLDFLKAINKKQHLAVGKRVVIIGCGNAGMDAAAGAYAMGAEEVVCIDVQKPAAFAHEIANIEAKGGKLLWPVSTKEITADGLLTADGTLIPADTVIITIGESPILDFLPEGIKKFRDWLVPAPDQSILPGVFAVGDTIRPGRLVDAIGSGSKAADAADAFLRGSSWVPKPAKPQVPAGQLATACFARVHPSALPAPEQDFERCISCGTCRDCQMCLNACPEKAISRIEQSNGIARYVSDPSRCIGCGICAGVCPCGVWTLSPNTEALSA